MFSRTSFIATICVISAASAGFAAVPGYIIDFNGGSVDPFYSGAELNWQASGGVGGAGDGWISVSRTDLGNLGAATNEPNVLGNLPADGVTGYSFWMQDLGSPGPLSIHVLIGDPFVNFWQSNIAFTPVVGSWTKYSIDFSDPSQWTQTQGSGTFEDAIANSGRLLFRHDLPPYQNNPNPVVGAFGLDRITVLPEPATLALLGAGGLLAARRKREA